MGEVQAARAAQGPEIANRWTLYRNHGIRRLAIKPPVKSGRSLGKKAGIRWPLQLAQPYPLLKKAQRGANPTVPFHQ